MLIKSGAKLLDFGLSKIQAGSDLLALSTVSPGNAPLTAAGEVLGTLPYMAPEQLAGKEADARSDLFGFGAIVYEMATGRRAFEGTSAATVTGAVLHTSPPPVSSLQPLTPAALDRIVARCLAKDPDDRWQTARDVLLELKWIDESLKSGHATGPARTAVVWRARAAWTVAGAAVLLLLAASALGIGYLRRTPGRESVQRLSLLLPSGVRFARLDLGGGAVISPDGERVVFVGVGADGKKLLWVRSLNHLEAVPLTSSTGAEYPFWSPDSRSIGFFAQGMLKKVAADGGPSLTICDAAQPRGGTWNDAGIILFSADAGWRWYRCAAAGGSAVVVTVDRPTSENYWPVFLPDGRHFIYFGRPETPGIYVASLDSTETRLLLGDHVGVAYAPPGYLLALSGSNRSAEDRPLVARKFDATRLQITGDPVVIAEHVAYLTLPARAAFSVSQNGRIVYESDRTPATQLLWFDRQGTQVATVADSLGYGRPSLSPDDKSVVVERLDANAETTDLWLLDTIRGIASRLTTDPAAEWNPVWSPDGSQVVFSSPRGTPPALYQQDSRKAGPGALLLSEKRVLHARDWSSDGRFLLYAALDPQTQFDLWVLPMLPAGLERRAEPFAQTELNEYSGQFSPDGRWVAYVSDESGALDVYVRSFPPSGARWRISPSGGSQPRWRRDGKELYFVAADETLVAVTVVAGDTFEVGTPRRLFKTNIPDGGPLPMNYAVTRDGQRFLIHSITDDSPKWSTSVLLNWEALMKH
jgi:Tol biopolymer transport system component